MIEKQWREITDEDRRRLHDAAIWAGRQLRERMRKRMEEEEEEEVEQKRPMKAES
jgi:hypothetical protein